MTSSAPALARTDVCPDCGAGLPGPSCPRCGLELVGPTAVRLLEVSREADRWLAEHRRLVRVLRAEAIQRRAAATAVPAPPPPPVTSPSPVPPPAPTTSSPVPSPLPAGPAPAVPPRRRTVLSVQSLLVGLGALLLAVASVVFLAFSWDRLGIAGRSTVVAAMTVAVLGGAVLARRSRMQLTAEAVGALGAVLVVLDAVAVRVTGLAGEGMGGLTYAAAAALVCAAVLAGVARLGRLRSLGCAAAALVPLAPVLLGGHLALAATAPDALTWFAAGLLAAAVPGLAAGALQARGATAEAAVLTWTGAAGAVGAGALLLVVGPWEPWQGAALAAGGAVLGSLHQVVPGGPAARTWAAVAGAGAAVAAALLATHLLGSWALLGAPMGVGLVALALRQVAGTSAGPVLVAARSALAVLAVAAAPAALVVVLHPLTVTATLLQPWSAAAATPWSSVTGVEPGDLLPTTDRTASFVAVLAVAGVLAGWWRASGAAAARRAAAVVLAVLVVCLPWQLDLPVLHVVVTALLLAAGAAGAGHLLRRRSGWVVEGTAQLGAGAAVGLLGVLAAWTVEPLSVPVTLVGVAALVLARRASGQAALDLPATAAALVALGGVVAWTGAAVLDAALVATVSGAVVVTAVSLLPRLAPADRQVAGATGVVALLLSVVPAAVVSPADREPRLLLVVLAGALAAGVLAADPARHAGAAVRAVASAALVPLVVLAAVLGVRVGGRAGGALAQVDPALAAAVVVAAALAAAAALHRGRRVLAPVVEASAAVCGSVVLAVAVAGLAGLRPEASWPLLVVLAVGAAALSGEPSRRWVGWVALLLASGALWDRLAAADVGAVEAFSLPPAAVLLAAGVLGARRDGVVARPSTVTGLALLVLPTAVASVGGPAARPAVLLVVAALAVVAARLVLRSGAGSVPGPARTQTAALLLASAGAGVLAGPVLRAFAAAAVPEVWSVPSAVVLLGAAAVLVRLPGAARAASWVLPAALVVATGPALFAGDEGPAAADLVRHLVPLVLGGAVLVHGSGAVRRTPVTWTALAVLVVTVLVGAARGLAAPVELLTLPAAAALALAGLRRMSVRPEQGSWPWSGPAAVLALVPSLVLATTDGPVQRTVLLAAGAAAVLLVGVRRGWQAPVVVGAGVLVVHAVVQLSPFVALAYQAVPRWASLALVGLVLLALGARYEARVRDVVTLRRRVATLR